MYQSPCCFSGDVASSESLRLGLMGDAPRGNVGQENVLHHRLPSTRVASRSIISPSALVDQERDDVVEPLRPGQGQWQSPYAVGMRAYGPEGPRDVRDDGLDTRDVPGQDGWDESESRVHVAVSTMRCQRAHRAPGLGPPIGVPGRSHTAPDDIVVVFGDRLCNAWQDRHTPELVVVVAVVVFSSQCSSQGSIFLCHESLPNEASREIAPGVSDGLQADGQVVCG